MNRTTRAFRGLAVLALALLLTSGIVAGLFWPEVVAALTLPRTTPSHARRPPPMPSPASMPKDSSPVATGVPWTMLANDSFQRQNQHFWGKASDGQTWGADANNSNVFAIVNGSGQLAEGQGSYTAILGPQATDAEVVFSASLSRFSATNVGALLRWSDTSNWYKASLDGTSLILDKKVLGAVTRLGILPFHAAVGRSYTMRFRVTGTLLAVKAWPTGTAEPPSWLLALSDSSLSTGYAGLRFVVRKRVTVQIAAFTVQGRVQLEERHTS